MELETTAGLVQQAFCAIANFVQAGCFSIPRNGIFNRK